MSDSERSELLRILRQRVALLDERIASGDYSGEVLYQRGEFYEAFVRARAGQMEKGVKLLERDKEDSLSEVLSR